MNRQTSLFTFIFILLFSFSLSANDLFKGMWTIDIEDGGVAWLHVHDQEGFLDAELLWIGGSVLPVSHVYHKDERTLVVTRTREMNNARKGKEGRKHIITYTLTMHVVGDQLIGSAVFPKTDGSGIMKSAFVGSKLPMPPAAPNLDQVKYGKPIALFNGKDLSGWKLLDPEHKNGFKVIDGNLVNDPVQEKGKDHIHYGNIRTEKEFEDFNLKLEVNVPEGNNSGVYLKGMYEVQVFDSYGKKLDSHHMGALYSRITPTVAAERPGGEWQSLDITLCDRHVTVILNGKTIIDNQPVYGPTGGAIISDVFAPGPIYLQGDHGNVSYKNIVLTPILK